MGNYGGESKCPYYGHWQYCFSGGVGDAICCNCYCAYRYCVGGGMGDADYESILQSRQPHRGGRIFKQPPYSGSGTTIMASITDRTCTINSATPHLLPMYPIRS